MIVEIDLIRTHAEYRAVEQLQRDIWSLEDAEIVPDHMLLTAQKNGGLLLGAFLRASDGPQSSVPQDQKLLVGFVFGFLGRDPEGRLKHCSHMAGVLPGYQDQNVGYRLKLAQREHVLAQGIDHITWTFDPLESRNAALNFGKLGVTCRTYLRDLYGPMRDGLNAGLSSDRFQVDWHLSSPQVEQRLRGGWAQAQRPVLLKAGIPLLELAPSDQPLSEAELGQTLSGRQILIAIPPDFQAIKRDDPALAGHWRRHTCNLFEVAFARGFTAVDLLYDGKHSCYLLERY